MSTFSAKRKRLQHGFDFERIIQDADSSLNGRAGAQAAVDAGASSSSVPNEQNDECLWELRTNVLHARGTAQATESVPSHVPCRSKVDIEGVPGAFLVPDVLSPDECELLIGLAEQLGFTPGEGIVSVPREVRDNDACVLVAPTPLLVELSSRLASVVPLAAPSGRRCDPDFVNARFRCYRYRADEVSGPQRFKPHFDGAQLATAVKDGRLVEGAYNGTRRSEMSVLLYLNGPHNGGETTFYPEGVVHEGARRVCVAPQAGAALCFWHGDHPQSPLHEGSALAEGSCEPKYVIRTDVLFYKPLNAAQDLQWESSKTNLAMMRAMAL
eukprot:gene18422-21977_t